LAADLGARVALILAGMAAEGIAHIEEIFGVNLQQVMQVHKRKAYFPKNLKLILISRQLLSSLDYQPVQLFETS
jgi:hypothetical protein